MQLAKLVIFTIMFIRPYGGAYRHFKNASMAHNQYRLCTFISLYSKRVSPSVLRLMGPYCLCSEAPNAVVQAFLDATTHLYKRLCPSVCRVRIAL